MIDLKNINKIYKRNKKQIYALKNINLHLNDTGFVCITGPSGSGKTTLLNLIYGNVIQTSGEIYHNNILYNKDTIKNDVSYIFQDYNLIDELTVYDNINLALQLNGIEKSKEEITEKLKKIGLEDVLFAYPFELSGGQQQRVAIVRASLTHSNIILADEPTGALDDDAAIDVMNLLKEEAKNKLVVVVSHNKNLVKKYADQMLEIKDGEIVSNEIINSFNKKEENEIFRKKKVGFKYLIHLGLKYFNFKSFKMYLSFLMMIITFTLLISTVSIMFFEPEKSYNSIDDKRYNYTLIEKYEKIDDINSQNIYSSKNEIDSFINEKCLIYNYQYELKNQDKSKIVDSIIVINENVIKNLKFSLVGELPKENEVLITKNMMNYLEETDYNKLKIDGFDKVSGYIEIDYVKEDDQYIDLNNSLYVSDFEYAIDYLLVGAITNKLDYKKVQNINNYKCENEKNFYNCKSICLDSVERGRLFVEVMKEIGIPTSIVLVFLSFIILINYVFVTVDSNKKDIKIIKMIGGNNKRLSFLFGVQPFLIISISLIVSYILYFVIKEKINIFIIEEFKMYLSILSLSFSKNIIIIFSIMLLFLLSVFIPIKKIKYIS